MVPNPFPLYFFPGCHHTVFGGGGEKVAYQV